MISHKRRHIPVMVKGAEIDTSRNQVNIIKNFDREIENKFEALH